MVPKGGLTLYYKIIDVKCEKLSRKDLKPNRNDQNDQSWLPNSKKERLTTKKQK